MYRTLGLVVFTEVIHALSFVEALRRRSNVAVLNVTATNRDDLIGVACSLLYRILFPAAIARAIEDKATLALRYLSELDVRLEALESVEGAYRFMGDHGTYELRPSAGDLRSCSCPFFQQQCTCSHTIALALRGEQTSRAVARGALAKRKRKEQPAQPQQLVTITITSRLTS